MANLIDQIFTGVIAYDKNEAIQSLAKIFGEQMLGVGTSASRIVMLSAALNPIYLGLLFMILAYIGIGGVIRTATEGKFLGQWNSIGVPGMFILCVVLLTPVPTQNSATLGQVIFVKGLKVGSNFADVTLMKVFDNAQTEAVTYSLASEQIPQINDQMKGAFLMYMCANQMTQMGYGSQLNYFVLLNSVCRIPADMVGLYAEFFILGDTTAVKGINERLQAITDATGLKLPPQGVASATAIADASSPARMVPASKQLYCHFKAFDDNFRGKIPAPLAVNAKLTQLAPVDPITGPNGSRIPTQLNNSSLVYNKAHLSVMWPETLNTIYRCVMTTIVSNAQDALKETYTANPDTAVPWRAGWSNAALAMSDELNGYKKALNASKLPLSMEVVAAPDVAQLGDNLTDKKNQGLLGATLTDVQEYTSGINNTPDQAGQVLSSYLMGKASAGASAVASAVPGSASDWSRVWATLVLPFALRNTAAIAAAGPNTAATMSKLKIANDFLGTLLGRTVSATPSALGKMSSTAAAWLGKSSFVVEAIKKKDALVESLGGGGMFNPIGMAAKVANSIASAALLPGPTTMLVLSIVLVVVNVVVLLPQVVLLVVMLIWMTKAAVWYMIIPLATVLIALPNTRVGHDIWKSALGIILTPFLALIFYIVSVFIFDQMYASIVYWIFEPIIRGFQSGGVSGFGSILMQILSGEIIFRFLTGVVVAMATTVYMSMLILRGPDLINSTLGLRGSSGDLGDEFNALRTRLDPTSRMQAMMR